MTSKSRDFTLMVIGQVISLLGSALLRFALSLYVLDITGRADIFATLFAISNIPMLFAPIGGAIADRYSRRNLMVIFDFTSSALVFFLFFMVQMGNGTLPVIAVVMVLLSTITSMYSPTVLASIPQLVSKEKIEGANGIVQAVLFLSNAAAPIFGGVFYGIFGLRMMIVISGIAFFLSAVMEIFIRIPFEKREQKGNMFQVILTDMKDGFRFIAKKAFIWKISLIATLINLVLTTFFMVGMPIILRIAMKSNDIMYGIGMASFYIASIIGALSIGFMSKKMKVERLHLWMIPLAVLCFGIALILLPSVLNGSPMLAYIGFILLILPLAMITTLLSIFLLAKMQIVTPNEYLGKVMASVTAICNVGSVIGQFIFGIMFEKFNGKFYLPSIVIGIVMLIIAVLYNMMHIKVEETADEEVML